MKNAPEHMEKVEEILEQLDRACMKSKIEPLDMLALSRMTAGQLLKFMAENDIRIVCVEGV